jgi:hypothetical protein
MCTLYISNFVWMIIKSYVMFGCDWFSYDSMMLGSQLTIRIFG